MDGSTSSDSDNFPSEKFFAKYVEAVSDSDASTSDDEPVVPNVTQVSDANKVPNVMEVSDAKKTPKRKLAARPKLAKRKDDGFLSVWVNFYFL